MHNTPIRRRGMLRDMSQFFRGKSYMYESRGSRDGPIRPLQQNLPDIRERVPLYMLELNKLFEKKKTDQDVTDQDVNHCTIEQESPKPFKFDPFADWDEVMNSGVKLEEDEDKPESQVPSFSSESQTVSTTNTPLLPGDLPDYKAKVSWENVQGFERYFMSQNDYYLNLWYNGPKCFEKPDAEQTHATSDSAQVVTSPTPYETGTFIHDRSEHFHGANQGVSTHQHWNRPPRFLDQNQYRQWVPPPRHVCPSDRSAYVEGFAQQFPPTYVTQFPPGSYGTGLLGSGTYIYDPTVVYYSTPYYFPQDQTNVALQGVNNTPQQSYGYTEPSRPSVTITEPNKKKPGKSGRATTSSETLPKAT